MAPAKLLARLQVYADKIKESESEVIRRAVEEHLVKNDGQAQSSAAPR